MGRSVFPDETRVACIALSKLQADPARVPGGEKWPEMRTNQAFVFWNGTEWSLGSQPAVRALATGDDLRCPDRHRTEVKPPQNHREDRVDAGEGGVIHS